MKSQPSPRKKRAALPAGVFEKHGAYYRVRAEGAKRKWIRLCAIGDGLPAMYLALSKLAAASSADDDLMPKLVDNWMIEIGSRHKAKTQSNDRTHNTMIARVFREYRARDIRPSDVIEFLKPFQSRPRSYNAYRTALRERLRYAESKDFRLPGSNPVDSVPTMSTKARQRYITDSELRRIKAAAMRGDDGSRTRAGFLLHRHPNDDVYRFWDKSVLGSRSLEGATQATGAIMITLRKQRKSLKAPFPLRASRPMLCPPRNGVRLEYVPAASSNIRETLSRARRDAGWPDVPR